MLVFFMLLIKISATSEMFMNHALLIYFNFDNIIKTDYLELHGNKAKVFRLLKEFVCIDHPYK